MVDFKTRLDGDGTLTDLDCARLRMEAWTSVNTNFEATGKNDPAGQMLNLSQRLYTWLVTGDTS